MSLRSIPKLCIEIPKILAGLGVSIAPACIVTLVMPGAVYRPLSTTCRTAIDLGTKTGVNSTLVRNFIKIASKHLSA